MRFFNTIKNILASIANQIMNNLLQFIIRLVFIRFLSVEYLGVSTLFADVLTILSLAELGIGSTANYLLYKPLKNKEIHKIKAAMDFIRKVYFIIGCVDLGLGIIMFPLLSYLVDTSSNITNIRLVYFLYIAQNVVSYWFYAYKSILLAADQKSYKFEIIQGICNCISACINIVLLIVFKSFLLYTMINVISILFSNFCVSWYVDKNYVYLKIKDEYKMSSTEKREAIKLLFGGAAYKINTVIVGATDSMVISYFADVAMVGVYGNYKALIKIFNRVFANITGGATASIGDLNAEGDKKKLLEVFNMIQLINYWLYGSVGICVGFLATLFIKNIFGELLVLTPLVVILIIIDFVTNGVCRTPMVFRDACGLMWKGKYAPIISAISNLIISALLAYHIGLAGVIYGTIISRIISNFLIDPILLYKYVFGKSVVKYFCNMLSYFLVLVISSLLLYKICDFSFNNWILEFIVKGIVCMVVTNALLFLRYCKTNEYKHMLKRIKRKR